MNVDIIVDNDKDKDQTNNNQTDKDTQQKSTAIISEAIAPESVPNAATIKSPFTRDESNANKSAESPDKASVDSVQSNTSEFKVEKYVPKIYRSKSRPVKRGSTFKLVRLDWEELNSCGAYSRFMTIGISLIIIVIIILDLNNEDTKENQLVNEMQSNKTLEKDVIKPISKVLEKNAKYYFTIVCAVAIFVETIILLSYSYHIVENFYKFPWLIVESIYTIGMALNFYPLSIWIAFYGFWFFIVAIIGLIVAIIFTIWAVIKVKKYWKGGIAQRRTDDPDGNTLRRMSPNLRFSDPKTDEFKRKLLLEKQIMAKEDNNVI